MKKILLVSLGFLMLLSVLLYSEKSSKTNVNLKSFSTNRFLLTHLELFLNMSLFTNDKESKIDFFLNTSLSNSVSSDKQKTKKDKKNEKK